MKLCQGDPIDVSGCICDELHQLRLEWGCTADGGTELKCYENLQLEYFSDIPQTSCPRLSMSPIQYESPGKIIRGKGDSDSNDLFPIAPS